jgi:type IV secretory pathway TraG/TraD family ATPase VirD4
VVFYQKDGTMNAFQWVQHLGMWAQQHQTLFLWIVGGGMAVMVVVNMLWRRRGLQPTSHGSARWATPREVAHGGLSTQHGVVVGQVAGMIYCDDGPTHLALFGPTRSGKGHYYHRRESKPISPLKK